jgi:ribosomal protein L7/L12
MTSHSEIIALRARIAELEARLDFLYRRLGYEYAPDALSREAEVVQLIREGRSIEAIKAYRAVYRVGLAEAKQAVDALQARLEGGQ